MGTDRVLLEKGTYRKSYMRFLLTPRSMTLDDIELLQRRILSEFRRISQIWEPPATKRMKLSSSTVYIC